MKRAHVPRDFIEFWDRSKLDLMYLASSTPIGLQAAQERIKRCSVNLVNLSTCLEPEERLSLYLKYFYLKNSICKTIVYCILYFMGAYKSILYFKY